MTLNDSSMLMNVIKLYPDLNLYLQIGQRVIRIFDEKMQKLKEIQIISANKQTYKQHLYGQGYILAQNGQQYHALVHNGQIYIQVLTCIYVVKNNSLQFLCPIPSTSGMPDALRGELFSFNNELYAFSDGEFFVFKNNQFKFVKKAKGPRQFMHYFCQFGNNVFCVQMQGVQLLKQDLSYEEIYTARSELDILCVNGGIMIVAEKGTDVVVAINMITKQVKKLKSDVNAATYKKYRQLVDNSQRKYQSLTASFIEIEEEHKYPRKLNDFQQLFCFGQCGLELKAEVQKELFGEDFPAQCKAEFDKHLRAQMNAQYIDETMKFVKTVREDWKQIEEDLKNGSEKVKEKKDIKEKAIAVEQESFNPFARKTITLIYEQEEITITAAVAGTDTIASVFQLLKMDPAEITCEKDLETPIKDLNIKESDKISFRMIGAEQKEPVNPFSAKKEAVNPFGTKPKEPVNPFDAKPKKTANPLDDQDQDQEPMNPFGGMPFGMPKELNELRMHLLREMMKTIMK
ncbi:Conserved_hypothetical protein [Hexamita inflata]|uniref:Uncharacterized protein n=1 Tax=Hexamita inflata TaxID=28002 RepID=A0AA86PJP0_9EUKA|nr:Conserved hypothetical protein [Hexamita inflata]